MSVIEIAGPPGAGKTTLVTRLGARHPDLRPMKEVRRLRFLPALAREAFLLAPLLAAQWREQRLSRRDAERMVRVVASQRIVRRARGGLLVMDQGPAYTLATLWLGLPAVRGRGRLGTWWCETLSRWARTLDAVVYLEAVDPVLLARMNGRATPHRIDDLGPEDAARWLATLRQALEHTVAALESKGVPVLRFDTEKEDADGLALRVASALSRSCAVTRGAA